MSEIEGSERLCYLSSDSPPIDRGRNEKICIEEMGRWRYDERTNNRSGKRLLLYLQDIYYILIARLDGRTPPKITLIIMGIITYDYGDIFLRRNI